MPPRPTIPRRAMRLIRPEDWNRVARKILAKKNRVYRTRESGGWRHPWETEARWDFIASVWALRVQPGYVNAAETLAPAMAASIAPRVTRERLGLPPASRERCEPWLSESPWIRVTPSLWREIGTGTVDSEPVPEFFAAQGVETGDRLVVDPASERVSVVAGSAVDPARRRLLRAVDLVLRVPKPTLQMQLVAATGGRTELTWTVAPAAGSPSLSVRRVHVPQAPPPTLQEQLVTGRVEDPHTESLVATVYLLSPPGTPLGTPIGPTWQPHVKHALFWNRAYQAKVTFNFVPATPLVSSIPLAGGAGQGIIQSILDDLNSRDAALSLALGQGATRVDFHSI